jgi:hypothetical protein
MRGKEQTQKKSKIRLLCGTGRGGSWPSEEEGSKGKNYIA